MKPEEARIEALRKLIPPEKVITAIGYKCEPPKNLIAKLVNPNFQIFFIVKFEDEEGIVWDMRYRPETIKQCIAEGNLWMDEVGHELKHRWKK